MAEGSPAMDHAAMKQAARDFLVAIGRRDTARIDALLHPEATYWVLGKPHLFSWAGERDRATFMQWAATPTIFVDGGAKVTFGEATAEGDRVALESTNIGVTPDGRTYTNAYHHLFTFRDGKILKVKEYLDTQSAAEFFSRPG
ncbi:nuclear transport factor 2 family protein [Novosphingobium album (ex Liu et al. 2023)]|uniref:Nuclear transport factor 2 family protein n=1 Tax=Novosphingobium album (ex Liu et al. 2023) TaxID=3031130 RepID=A0ABT5WVP8_9SPHN|nr:nuclear transport factor 2 family protein [Novosphingobium album (ex Liu et al. 2023)]MDE8653975.1 nuclear transport factor 2 family protein [Novosphingobium album (ex Liu et al. 2023)]